MCHRLAKTTAPCNNFFRCFRTIMNMYAECDDSPLHVFLSEQLKYLAHEEAVFFPVQHYPQDQSCNTYHRSSNGSNGIRPHLADPSLVQGTFLRFTRSIFLATEEVRWSTSLQRRNRLYTLVPLALANQPSPIATRLSVSRCSRISDHGITPCTGSA